MAKHLQLVRMLAAATPVVEVGMLNLRPFQCCFNRRRAGVVGDGGMWGWLGYGRGQAVGIFETKACYHQINILEMKAVWMVLVQEPGTSKLLLWTDNTYQPPRLWARKAFKYDWPNVRLYVILLLWMTMQCMQADDTANIVDNTILALVLGQFI